MVKENSRISEQSVKSRWVVLAAPCALFRTVPVKLVSGTARPWPRVRAREWYGPVRVYPRYGTGSTRTVPHSYNRCCIQLAPPCECKPKFSVAATTVFSVMVLYYFVDQNGVPVLD